jgi:hypothetical protein
MVEAHHPQSFDYDELGILANSVNYMEDEHEINLLSLFPNKEGYWLNVLR